MVRITCMLMGLAGVLASAEPTMARQAFTRWSENYPALAIRLFGAVDPDQVAAIAHWRTVLVGDVDGPTLRQANAHAARIRDIEGLNGWVEQRIIFADSAVWGHPVGHACLAWHRQRLVRRLDELVGRVDDPPDPDGPEGIVGRMLDDLHQDALRAQAVAMAFAPSAHPLAIEAASWSADLAAAAVQARDDALAGGEARRVINSYHLGQVWSTWERFARRHDTAHPILVGWLDAYALELRPLLVAGLRQQPSPVPDGLYRACAAWDGLVAEHQILIHHYQAMGYLEQEFASLPAPDHAAIRVDIDTRFAAAAAASQAWLNAVITRDATVSVVARADFLRAVHAVSVAQQIYAQRGRCAQRLAKHPQADAPQRAAIQAALAAWEAALQRKEAAWGDMLASTLDADRLAAESTAQDAAVRAQVDEANVLGDAIEQVLAAP